MEPGECHVFVCSPVDSSSGGVSGGVSMMTLSLCER